MAQEGDGFGDVAGDGGVGDAEAGGLDAAGVVGVDVGDGDGALGVRHELGDGAGELAQVGAQGVDERPDGLGLDAPAGAARVGVDEGGLVPVLLDRLAGDDGVGRGGDGVEELLSALAGVVAQDDDDVGVGGGDVGEQVGEQRVRHLLEVGHVDELGLAEEGGRDEGVEHMGLVGGDVEADDLRGGVLGAGLGEKSVDGALAEELLSPSHEDDGREVHLVP